MYCPTQFTHFRITRNGEINFFHANDGIVKVPLEKIQEINTRMKEEQPKGWFEATCMLERAASEHSRFFPDSSPSPI